MAMQMKDLVQNKYNNKLVIEEQRNFSNPHIRFRRIKGRIVPIWNKKRIGQDFSTIGNKAMKTGALITAAGLGKRYLSKKKSVQKLTKKFTFKTPSFGWKPTSRKARFAKATAKFAGRGAKFGFRNMTKLGILATGLGAASSLLGAEFQAQSMFGKDFFFIRDEHGREN